MPDRTLKRQKLRNNEYYIMQDTLDDLYEKSKKGYKFNNLIDLISSKENIELAYRNIKKNKGGKTAGTNGKTIEDIKLKTNEDIVLYVQKRLKNYHPHPVKRIEIPKDNGKTRPLGIPTIEDRIIQQCIKQILEPICEAKFYEHSYGFRPNRSTHHAIAKSMFMMQKNNLHYVVDIDIKGFFDNVNHGKLLKQMWSMGIRDKQLLCIISKMLKAPIEGIGTPTKGTPQGGILSPLLSNIVLNELDWWIAGQWEYFETKHDYTTHREKNGKKLIERSNKYRALRSTSKMKEVFIVRYADDFKLFCKDYETARKIFIATELWLKERLKLEISKEKSKIVNLRKKYSEFLGFKLKVRSKSNKMVVKSHISDKSKEKIKRQLKQQINKLSKSKGIKEATRYNSVVLGMHNYYKVATNVNIDFSKIAFEVSKYLYNRTKRTCSDTGIKSKAYEKIYGNYNFKVIYLGGIALFPIAGVTTRSPASFNQDICNYTVEGRRLIHESLKCIDIKILKYLMDNPNQYESAEYNDNRISLYVGQNGMCPISETYLEIGDMECHHKKPRELGGTDDYKNLVFLKRDVHKLIHATSADIINKYMNKLKLTEKSLKKLNKLRVLAGNLEIA